MVDVAAGRNELAKLFNGKTGIEVGVEQGVFSEVICKAGARLYGVDPWLAYKGYREHVTQEKLDGFFNITNERMAPYEFTAVRQTSVEASKLFEDESLDFVYIDANHSYESVLEDLSVWVPKVKPGGIVSGHDYIKRKGQDHMFGVKQAINEYAEQNNRFMFIWRGDKSPSWMFIK